MLFGIPGDRTSARHIPSFCAREFGQSLREELGCAEIPATRSARAQRQGSKAALESRPADHDAWPLRESASKLDQDQAVPDETAHCASRIGYRARQRTAGLKGFLPVVLTSPARRVPPAMIRLLPMCIRPVRV